MTAPRAAGGVFFLLSLEHVPLPWVGAPAGQGQGLAAWRPGNGLSLAPPRPLPAFGEALCLGSQEAGAPTPCLSACPPLSSHLLLRLLLSRSQSLSFPASLPCLPISVSSLSPPPCLQGVGEPPTVRQAPQPPSLPRSCPWQPPPSQQCCGGLVKGSWGLGGPAAFAPKASLQ